MFEYSNYLSWFSEWVEREEKLLLNEGLIKSYPLQNVMDVLKKHTISIDISTKSGLITAVFKKDKFQKDKLLKILDTYGYFIGDTVINDNNQTVSVLIEPKFPAELPSELIGKLKYAYHITTNDYIDKIKKIGLIPKQSSRPLFDHSGNRIYLLVTPDFNKDVAALANMIKRNDSRKNRSTEHINKELLYYVLRIDMSALQRKLFFYRDPRMVSDVHLSGIGIFTLGNIPPENIEIGIFTL